MIISESVPASVEVFHFDVFFHRFLGVGNNSRMGKFPIPRENSRVFYGFPYLRFFKGSSLWCACVPVPNNYVILDSG